jgi:hypothetical protein
MGDERFVIARTKVRAYVLGAGLRRPELQLRQTAQSPIT